MNSHRPMKYSWFMKKHKFFSFVRSPHESRDADLQMLPPPPPPLHPPPLPLPTIQIEMNLIFVTPTQKATNINRRQGLNGSMMWHKRCARLCACIFERKHGKWLRSESGDSVIKMVHSSTMRTSFRKPTGCVFFFALIFRTSTHIRWQIQAE